MTPAFPPLHLIDAFTDGTAPFTGNPAGVCLLRTAAEPAWMQAVAAEMNQAETAFLVPTDRPDTFDLRWFTPRVEVDLCGHATLAAAAFLDNGRRPATVVFRTRSGPLTCTRRADEWIEMDFPATPAVAADPPAGLFDALGLPPSPVARSRFDYLVELPTVAAVAAVSPDLRRLVAIDTRGVIVTAAGGDGADFVSRFFAPAVGVNEDPVTGSAHCALAGYWADRLGRAGELTGRQLSRRGGVVRCTPAGDRVRLAGRAVTVLTGRLSAQDR